MTGKPAIQIKTNLRQTDEAIDEWFQKHFNHVTPGTPDYAVLTAARDDLKAALTQPGADLPSETPAPPPAEPGEAA